eukprot:1871425-Ditylum_brightwellii.AAC.1
MNPTMFCPLMRMSLSKDDTAPQQPPSTFLSPSPSPLLKPTIDQLAKVLHRIKTLCANKAPLLCPIQKIWVQLHKYRLYPVLYELRANVHCAPLVNICKASSPPSHAKYTYATEYLLSQAVQGPEPLPSMISAHCAPSLPVPLLFTPQKLSCHKLLSQHSLLCPPSAPDHFTAGLLVVFEHPPDNVHIGKAF